MALCLAYEQPYPSPSRRFAAGPSPSPAPPPTLRVGEHRGAPAILRGLGAPPRPTAMRPPRFSWRDAVFTLILAALAAASVLLLPENP